MIPANKKAWVAQWLARDAERRIRREFGTVRIHGLAETLGVLRNAPVLFVCNHTAWWDPLVLQYLSLRVLRTDAYAMMDAKNLRRLPFFRFVGAFGVDLDSPSDGTRAIRYSVRLLDKPGRAVWIFPQGREVPVTVRPLAFLAGSAQVHRVARQVAVVPLAIRYEFGAAPRPDMWLSFGAPVEWSRDRDVLRRAHEGAVESELDRIEKALTGDDPAAFEPWLSVPPGRAFKVAQAALAWLSRLPRGDD